MIITIDTAKKLTEVEVNLLKVLLGMTVNVKNRAETVSEATKEVKPKPEVKKRVETLSKVSEEKVEKDTTIFADALNSKIPTLAELKALAQECVKVKDRNAVKTVINKFAPKLTEVKTDDYVALNTELTALKG